MNAPENTYLQVSARYAQGAAEKQAALCCPVDYDPRLLEKLPQEIIDKDYGCGDPSRYVQEGDTVLDLGSGGGKVCYIAAQLVGEQGRVIGVDMTDAMLALARKYQAEMAQKIGSERVEFKKGYIQDLALNVAELEHYLSAHPVTDVASLDALKAWQHAQRQERPLVADSSVSLVISNCVLNLVAERDRQQLVAEIFRVLKPGGRVAISDIVADEQVPQHLRDDAQLWSGCISGAFHEKEFLEVFTAAGFVAAAYDKWDPTPWQVVEGIEFRAVTLTAVKPSRENLYDGGHGVLYKGPYAQVRDDLGNTYPRGERIAISRRTYELIVDGPYRNDFIGFAPPVPVNLGGFCKPSGTLRPVAETKGGPHRGGDSGASCC